MLLILLNWCWMAVSFFSWGFFLCRRVIFRRRPADSLRMDEVLVTGIIGTALFAQVFSFFGGIGTIAYCLHFVLTAGLLWMERKEAFRYIGKVFSGAGIGNLIGTAALAAVFAVLTSMPSRLYDDYLYHIQIIRWIQEYGIVKGLGNLHTRFAFMSSSFFPQALFSWAKIGLFGEGIYGFTGFCSFGFFLLCSRNCMRFIASRIRGEKAGRIPEFALSAAGILYFVYIKFGVAGLSTDILPNILTIYVFMKWFGMEERPGDGQYRLIALLTSFAMTLNMSAAILVLLTLWPMILYIRKKEFGKTFGLIALCAAPVIPMVIRSILISGYLIWPSSMLSFIAFPWKVPQEVLAAYREQVTSWGRMISTLPDGAAAERFTVWFPNWFRQEGIDMKVLTVLSFGAIAASAVLLAIRIRKKQFGIREWALIISEIAFAFWLWNAPNPRFNQSVTWILLIAFVNALGIRTRFEIKTWMWKAAAIAIALAVPVGGYAFYRMAKGSAALEYRAQWLVRPAAFDQEWPYEELRIQGKEGAGNVILYVNSDPEEDRQGYHVFPAVPPYHGKITLLGNTIRDGFGAE